MAYHLNIRRACPKRPRFDPARGIGSIKGGCEYCWRLVRLRHDIDSILDKAADLAAPKRRRKEAA